MSGDLEKRIAELEAECVRLREENGRLRELVGEPDQPQHNQPEKNVLTRTRIVPMALSLMLPRLSRKSSCSARCFKAVRMFIRSGGKAGKGEPVTPRLAPMNGIAIYAVSPRPNAPSVPTESCCRSPTP